MDNFYVLYDKNDEVIAIFLNLEDLSKFLNKDKKILKFRFKTSDIIYVKIPNLVKIYKFS